jgi:urease accessory protein
MDDAGVLALLQLADSGFPSGAYVLSHGLETLAADGWVRDAGDLAQAVEVLLLDRAAKAELPILLAAHRLAVGPGQRQDGAPAATFEAIAILDRRLETVKLAPEERAGSARVGRRLLAEGARLFPSSDVPAYAAVVRRGAAPGHAAVAQGLVFAAAGVSGRAAALAAASGLASGVLTAAMRLGLIGHGDAQRLLLEARPVIAAAVERAAAADPTDLRPSAPMLDIAVARHARAEVRVFAS